MVNVSGEDWVAGPANREYYIAVTGTELEYNWHQARAFCMQRGADLVSIGTDDEKTFIINQVCTWVGQKMVTYLLFWRVNTPVLHKYRYMTIVKK